MYLLFSISLEVKPQWMPAQGLEGAEIKEILLYDSLIFISGNGNGIFRKHVNDPFWNLDHYPGVFSRIRMTDTVIFAAHSWYNCFSRSFDSGENWEEIEYPFNMVQSMDIIGNTVFVSHIGDIFKYQDVLFAGTYLGIYYYDELSKYWIEFNDSISTSTFVHSFITIGENLNCCTSTGFYELNIQDNCWMQQNDGMDNLDTYSAYEYGNRFRTVLPGK
jgi:hypothetical protein